MGWGRFDNSFIRGGGKTYAVGLMFQEFIVQNPHIIHSAHANALVARINDIMPDASHNKLALLIRY